MPLEYDDITPTGEQAAILDAFEAGKHLAVTALAGVGKTSTLRMCGETIRRKSGVYLAFNSAIAKEAKATFPMRVDCRTAHSLAFRAIGNSYKERLNSRRMAPWDVAKALGLKNIELPEGNIHSTRAANLVREMVGRFCHTSDEFITADHVPFVRGLETHVDPYTKEVVPSQLGLLGEQLLPFAIKYWEDVRDINGRFRFEHDNYLKIWCLTHPIIPGDFILVDEAQDLNGVLVALVEDQDHMQKVIVGDNNQQIYGWRGSLNAMEVFPVDATLPLTQSWRFGPEIAAAANVFLEQLDSPLRISGNPDKVSRVGASTAPDAILCRTNAGGLEMALGAMQQGRKVHFAGGRPAEMLSFCDAVLKMQADQIVMHPDLAAFSSWQQVLDYVKTTSDPEFTMMVNLIVKYGAKLLIITLNALVPPAKADLTISTGHSAKGLEWSQVRLAADFAPQEGEEERIITEEETRLRYVAVTRAADVLDPGPLAKDLGSEDDNGVQAATDATAETFDS